MERRAAIYVRVSTDKQTIENQRRELRQIAERRGWQPSLYHLTGGGRRIQTDPRPVHHERIDSWHYGRPTFGVQILHALTRLGAKMSKHPKLPELLKQR